MCIYTCICQTAPNLKDYELQQTEALPVQHWANRFPWDRPVHTCHGSAIPTFSDLLQLEGGPGHHASLKLRAQTIYADNFQAHELLDLSLQAINL